MNWNNELRFIDFILLYLVVLLLHNLHHLLKLDRVGKTRKLPMEVSIKRSSQDNFEEISQPKRKIIKIPDLLDYLIQIVVAFFMQQ